MILATLFAIITFSSGETPSQNSSLQPDKISNDSTLPSTDPHPILFPSSRPPPINRTFVSTAIDTYIDNLVPQFKDPDLATIFSNALPNTLDTTVFSHEPNVDTFIITGDITAMWLRDSTRQVNPYIRFIGEDEGLSEMLSGLVLRQARSVALDSYANAFQIDGSVESEHSTDKRTPPMRNTTFEGKYELDSLVSFFKLSSEVYGEQAKGGRYDAHACHTMAMLLAAWSVDRGVEIAH